MISFIIISKELSPENYFPMQIIKSYTLSLLNLVQAFTIFNLILLSTLLAQETDLKKLQATLDQIVELSPLEYLPSNKSIDKKFHPVLNRVIKSPSKSKNEGSNPTCQNNVINELKVISKSEPRGLRDEAHYILGLLYEDCGELEIAANEYKTSLKLRNNNPQGHFRYGVVLLRLGNFENAKIRFEESLWRRNKKEYLAHYLTGLSLLHTGKTDAALKSFQKSSLMNKTFSPPVLESLKIRKELRSKVGSPQELALIDAQIGAELATVNRLGAGNREVALEYVRYLLLSGDPITSPDKLVEGLSIADEWISKSNVNDDDMLLMKIQIMEKRGRAGEAFSVLNERATKGNLSAALEAKKVYFKSLFSEDEQ